MSFHIFIYHFIDLGVIRWFNWSLSLRPLPESNSFLDISTSKFPWFIKHTSKLELVLCFSKCDSPLFPVPKGHPSSTILPKSFKSLTPPSPSPLPHLSPSPLCFRTSVYLTSLSAVPSFSMLPQLRPPSFLAWITENVSYLFSFLLFSF